MSFTQGTVVADGIVPLGNNATHYDVNGYSGFRVVDTLAERNAIFATLRKVGMEVKVLADGLTYSLAADGSWAEVEFGKDAQNSLVPASSTLAPSVDAVTSLTGQLADLVTANKTTLVSAINEASGKGVTAVLTKTDRTRKFYTGAGTNANTVANDGLTQALNEAVAGDTVVQITPTAIGGLTGNSQQILLKSGINFDSSGFNIDATAGAGDAITLQGGTGTIFGNNSVVKNSGSGSWGIGWYGSATNVNYKLYDLHFVVTVGNAILCGNSAKLYHTGNVTGTSSVMVVVRSSTYEHVGNITVNSAATAFYADRTNSKVVNTGDITLTAGDSKLGIITTSSTVELRNGVVDLTVPGIAGVFKIDSTSTLILKDVTVLGTIPVKASVAGQAAGATVYLYGSTTYPAGTFDPEIRVFDLRNAPATANTQPFLDSTNSIATTAFVRRATADFTFPFCVVKANGVVDTVPITFTEAIASGNAGGPGTVIYATRPAAQTGLTILNSNVTLDMMGHSLSLGFTAMRMQHNARIRNCSLMYNGRMAPDFNIPGGNTIYIQAKVMTARINFVIDTQATVVFDGTQIVNFGQREIGGTSGGPATSAEGGTVRLTNGAGYPDPTYQPSSITVIIREPLPLEQVRTTISTSPTQAADHTLVAADAGNVVPFTVAASCTIPANVFPVNTVIEVAQEGTGQVTITAGAGVTLYFADGVKTAKQWASVSLHQRALNKWVVLGGSV